MNNSPAEKIKTLFNEISPKYDVANSFMTLGLDKFWRRKLVRWSEAKPGEQILDVATGTGKLAFEFFTMLHAKVSVTGVDFSQGMLNLAIKERENLEKNINKLAKISHSNDSNSHLPKSTGQLNFALADALDLPFPNNCFDVLSISFGLRNVEDKSKALTEFFRVLKPGGRLMILEAGGKDKGLISKAGRLYFNVIATKIGSLLSKNPAAYNYLRESSYNFYSSEELSNIISELKIASSIESKVLLGGCCYIIKAVKY